MARYDFGGTLADFVVTSRRLGGLDVLGLSAATLTFWSAQSGGTRYTDLTLNGSAASSISVGTDGQVPKFQGPDGITEMWADGGSPRVRVVTLQGAPGPAGKDGINGANGLPGVNATPADSAVAAYVTGPSATKTAADAIYGSRSGNRPVGQGEVVINVRDYVTGTIGTDDTAAIASAITAAQNAAGAAATFGAGIRLHFGAGTYRTASQTLTADKVTVSGDGAVLLATNVSGATQPVLVVAGSYVQVYGLTIDHATRPDPLTENKSPGAHGLSITGPSVSSPGTFARVQDVKVIGARMHGIQVRYMQSATVKDCMIDKALATGIYVYDVHDLTLRDNTVSNTRDDNVMVSSDDAFGNVCHRVSITGNHLSNSQEKGIGMSGVLGATITGNTVENTYAPGIYALQDSAFGQGTSSTISITGNTVVGAGSYFGAGMKHTTQGTIANAIGAASGGGTITVSGNTIDSPTSNGVSITGPAPRVNVGLNTIKDAGGNGIFIGAGSATDTLNVTSFNVSGNVLEGIFADGIDIQHSSVGQVLGNTIRTWGKADTGTRRAVFVSACDTVTVSDNLLYNDATSASTRQGVLITGTTSYWEFNNPFRSATATRFGQGFVVGTRAVSQGTAAPTTGTWSVGDEFVNTAPASSGGYVLHGWRCTTAGTPGTWTPLYVPTSPTAAGDAPVRVIRSTTATTNSTVNAAATITTDDTLQVPVAANATYEWRAYLKYTSGSTPKLKIGVTSPTGTSGDWCADCLISSVTTGNSGSVYRNDLSMTATAVAAGTGIALVAKPSGIFTTGSTAGTFGIQWAQSVADPTDSTLMANSHLVLTRIS